MNYRLIAVQIGDLLKYSTSINDINRLAGAIFRFQRESFPNESITSQMAQLIHDWILSLAKQEMNPEERNQLLRRFCHSLATDQNRKEVDKVLFSAGISQEAVNREDYTLFLARDFHPEIIRHCKELFLQGNYFHAVFEACKAYNLCASKNHKAPKTALHLCLMFGDVTKAYSR
jgi:hypothetical protein